MKFLDSWTYNEELDPYDRKDMHKLFGEYMDYFDKEVSLGYISDLADVWDDYLVDELGYTDLTSGSISSYYTGFSTLY